MVYSYLVQAPTISESEILDMGRPNLILVSIKSQTGYQYEQNCLSVLKRMIIVYGKHIYLKGSCLVSLATLQTEFKKSEQICTQQTASERMP